LWSSHVDNILKTFWFDGRFFFGGLGGMDLICGMETENVALYGTYIQVSGNVKQK
jgi:hypothetical protein